MNAHSGSASAAPSAPARASLIAALCGALSAEARLGVVTNDIYTTEDAEFLRSTGVLPEERIAAVQTGGCPHTAIRDDISANLEAVEELEAATGPLDVVFVESGGDNLTAIFSPALADVQIFVIDVAAGDDIPRKGGPGIARADLLAINKTDLAPYVGSDVERMVREASERRGELPVAAISLRADVTPGRRLGPRPARGVPRPRPPALVHGRRPRSPPRSRPLSTRQGLSTVASGWRELRRGSGSRRGCSAPGRMTLLRSQAGPLAGDHDRVEIVVESGTLRIEPIAATVALPGPRADACSSSTSRSATARTLELEDAPLVVAEGADVAAHDDDPARRRRDGVRARPRRARPRRRGPGRLESLLRIEGPDGVILHDALRIEPGADDAYVALAPGHRAVGTLVGRQRRREWREALRACGSRAERSMPAADWPRERRGRRS